MNHIAEDYYIALLDPWIQNLMAALEFVPMSQDYRCICLWVIIHHLSSLIIRTIGITRWVRPVIHPTVSYFGEKVILVTQL
jgi:hypothetical protein